MSKKEDSYSKRMVRRIVNSTVDKGLVNSANDAIASFSKGADSEDKHTHFADGLLEKLVKYAVSDVDPDKEELSNRMNSSDRADKPKLSFGILISNLKVLSGRMSKFFVAHYGLLHIISWQKPSKTLSVLVLYTWLCLWPHLVLAYPLIFIIFGVMIPGYLHRHPMRTPELIPVKKRGQSLWDFINSSNDKSIVNDYFDPPTEEQQDQIEQEETHGLRQSLEATQQSQSVVDQEKLEKSPKTSKIKKQLHLMLNMRDLQNLTTDIIKAYDKAECFWYEKAGFKDENLSTFLFYGIIAATGLILFFGPYIPWRAIFIQTGWAAFAFCHPNAKSSIKYFMAKPTVKKRKEIVVKEVKKYEREDIIVDESAEIRKVEIFELHRKNLSTGQWQFFIYTDTIFSIKDHLRVSGKIPDGVDHLSKVKPPKDWKFDIGYVNEWVIDTQPMKFLKDRCIDTSDFDVKHNETEGWIYDPDSVDSDIEFKFRRRRLSRECFRYARPPRTPHLDGC